MRLSDIMSHMNLTIYPEIALILFLAIFAGVVVYTIRGGSRGTWEEESRIPVRDDEVQ